MQKYKSAWMVVVELWTIFLQKDCGGPSSTKKCTLKNTPRLARLVKALMTICTFTITNVYINLWTIAHRQRFIARPSWSWFRRLSFSHFLLITGQRKSRDRCGLCPVIRLGAALRLLSSRAVSSASQAIYCIIKASPFFSIV